MNGYRLKDCVITSLTLSWTWEIFIWTVPSSFCRQVTSCSQNHKMPVPCPFLLRGLQGVLLQPMPGQGRGQFSQSAKFHAWDMNALMFTMVLLMLCVLIFLLPLIVLNFLFACQWGELVCFALWPCWSPKWQDNWRWRLVVSKGLEFIWYFCYTTAISIHALYILLNLICKMMAA